MAIRRLLAAIGVTGALATGVTLVPAAVPHAQAAGTWGAIAWNRYGRAGGGYGSATPGPAIREAMRRCGPGCGYFTFHDSCGAVAYRFTYGRTEVGRAWNAPSHAAAKRAAIDEIGGGWVSRVNSVCSWG
ncbi:DUF4189 domain-containing protein [Gordonia sp. X0973]|uniref:DUF4189 domain-containing protein n=1 Tax=Gordonia sp. X0973 TaxID=2742602 RepID=UPI000F5493BB|nr:DUF4189 domain-containing protein [Gordonia sp. X0973]QKT05881.1 DUF4189 domain-containing protein [Gordonia sp. X0973]